jgi:hypothetical protein
MKKPEKNWEGGRKKTDQVAAHETCLNKSALADEVSTI